MLCICIYECVFLVSMETYCITSIIMQSLDGVPLMETGIDGVPLVKDENIDGEPSKPLSLLF